CQALAKRAYVDSRAFGIVIRRDINLDVSGVGDGLASDETGTSGDNEKDDEIVLHFSLTNRKLNHRFSGRKSQWHFGPTLNNRCIYREYLINKSLMTSIWRKHLIICLSLGLLALPIYFLDHALLGPQAGGGNWI